MKTFSTALREHAIIVALVILVTASLPILFVMASGGSGLAADRLKRINELEARAAQHSEELAQKDAQRESQRAVYIERIRKGEAQVRAHLLEILALRARADVVASPILDVRQTSRD